MPNFLSAEEVASCLESIARGDKCPACGVAWSPKYREDSPSEFSHYSLDHEQDCDYLEALDRITDPCECSQRFWRNDPRPCPVLGHF